MKPIASVKLPAFTSTEAGRFKKVSLTWKAASTSKGRQIGARLESNGAQIAWDNVRLVEEPGSGSRTIVKAKKQSVKPVSKPKVKQTTKSGGLVSTDWVGTDRYGRTMADFAEAGPKKPNKYVGLFYYIWHGQHTPPWGNDVTKYLKQHDGDINGMRYFPVPNAISKDPWGYYWAEPEDGYYHSLDPWILRKHLRLFATAGVDFLYFDCTNGWTYLIVVEELCKASLELRAQGLKTPQIVFTVSSGANAAIQALYDQFYSKGKYSELWFRWEGKPLILGHKDKAPNEEVASFFTWRKSDAWSGVNEDRWDWINPCGYGWHEKVAQIEQMSVAKGSHPTINVGSSYVVNNFSGAFPGGDGYQPPVDKFYLCKETGKGAYFESQWQNTLSKYPQVVMITQWNEWIAGCFKFEPGGQVATSFLGRDLKSGDRYFVDEFNAEFNRDIEPMKSGYGDVFVYRMLHYIRKFKGMDTPVRTSGPKTIPIDGIFTEWGSVQPSYTDFKGDTAHRDFMAYDGGMEIPARFPGDDNIYMKPVDPSVTKHRYTNTTGRNDIIACKVAYDNRSLSMYVKTAANMTPYTDRNWMMLFLDTDNNKGTGWEGYDYVINADVKDAKTTTLKKWVNGDWKLVTSIPYAQRGNQMEIAIPLKSLGIDPKAMSFNFHWADNMQNIKDVTEFNSNGDSAPDRSFNFHYSN